MENLEKIAKKHLDQSVLRKNLAEKADQSLTLAYNGGLFKITPELIAFSMFSDKDKDMFMKDDYNNPIRFTSEEWEDFMFKMREKYNEVMNDWHCEFEALKKIRKEDQL